MSQIRSFDEALDFYPGSTKNSARAGARHFFRTAAAFWHALVEGQAAARDYHLLRDRGVSHEVAASQVFARHYKN